jgi:hypothetical protein
VKRLCKLSLPGGVHAGFLRTKADTHCTIEDAIVNESFRLSQVQKKGKSVSYIRCIS